MSNDPVSDVPFAYPHRAQIPKRAPTPDEIRATYPAVKPVAPEWWTSANASGRPLSLFETQREAVDRAYRSGFKHATVLTLISVAIAVFLGVVVHWLAS